MFEIKGTKRRKKNHMKNNYCMSFRHIFSEVSQFVYVCVSMWCINNLLLFFAVEPKYTHDKLMNEDVVEINVSNEPIAKFHLQYETKYAWNELMIVFVIKNGIKISSSGNSTTKITNYSSEQHHGISFLLLFDKKKIYRRFYNFLLISFNSSCVILVVAENSINDVEDLRLRFACARFFFCWP